MPVSEYNGVMTKPSLKPRPSPHDPWDFDWA
jgi:hypothetical protein